MRKRYFYSLVIIYSLLVAGSGLKAEGLKLKANTASRFAFDIQLYFVFALSLQL
jgi:hypothetical protein